MAKNRIQTLAVKFTIGVVFSLQLPACVHTPHVATAAPAPIPQVLELEVLRSSSLSCLQQTAITLAQSQTIVHAVNSYNQALAQTITDEQWSRLDEHAPEVQALTDSIAAQAMASAIEQAAWQGEGILMGEDGGLVAITAKTSDFWQADEVQFTSAIHLQTNETFVQTQVVDTSSQLLLIKISVPIWSPQHNAAVGVLTLGLDQFVADFNAPCKLHHLGHH